MEIGRCCDDGHMKIRADVVFKTVVRSYVSSPEHVEKKNNWIP